MSGAEFFVYNLPDNFSAVLLKTERGQLIKQQGDRRVTLTHAHRAAELLNVIFPLSTVHSHPI
jgi:hypothetical protein